MYFVLVRVPSGPVADQFHCNYHPNDVLSVRRPINALQQVKSVEEEDVQQATGPQSTQPPPVPDAGCLTDLPPTPARQRRVLS